MTGEAQRHAESAEVLLQESISVSSLVEVSHGALELLQPRSKILLVLPAIGQVGLHRLSQQEVVPCVCALRRAAKPQEVRVHCVK